MGRKERKERPAVATLLNTSLIHLSGSATDDARSDCRVILSKTIGLKKLNSTLDNSEIGGLMLSQSEQSPIAFDSLERPDAMLRERQP